MKYKNKAKMGTKIDGKSVKITSISWKWKPWAHWAAFASSVCAGNAKRRRPASRFSFFCEELLVFGCRFGPSWIPRGVQKSCFWISCWKNDEKRVSENETRKTSKFDRKFVPKWDGLGSENERFAGDVLQNKGFRGIVKYWENWCQRNPKSDQNRSQ